MPRISRDKMFLDIADVVAQRSTCDRAHVGAVLAVNNRIISIGYNGAAPGQPHCDEIGHNLVGGHCTNAIHAEVNCIDFGVQLLDLSGLYNHELTLYVSHEPCWKCLPYITQHKKMGMDITRVVYRQEYGQDPLKIDYLEEWGISLERIAETVV